MTVKQVFRFDANKYFKEPVIIRDNDPIPADCTEIQPPDGLYKGQFVNGQWVEGLTPTEVTAIKNTKPPLSEIDKIKKNHTDLMYQLMMKGVI